MYLRTLITVNWGNLPNRAYDLGGMSLLTGGSGSGKTTMADAVQTVMTAAKRGLFMYNPGQDEATQYGKGGKTPRTLASYILGADDNNYARPNGAHGYVALVFAPSEGEPDKPGFSAIIAVSASVLVENLAGGRRKRTPKEENFSLLLAEGVGVEMDDFIQSKEAGDVHILPTDKIYGRLRQRYGDSVLHEFQNKTKYLSKLYGFLRGKRTVSVPEAEQAARTFSKFMAYKPIEGINEFVKTEVLEPHNIKQDIERISTLMRNVYELREESERLKSNIELLEQAREHGEVVRQAWFERKEQALCLAYKSLHDTRKQIANTEHLIQEDRRKEQRLQEDVQEINRNLDDIDQQRLRIERMRQRFDAAVEKDRLDKQISDYRERLNQSFQTLLGAVNDAKRNLEYAKQLLSVPVYVQEKPMLADAFNQLKRLMQSLETFPLSECGALCNEIAAAGESPAPELFDQLRTKLTDIDGVFADFAALINNENGLRSLTDREWGSLQQDLHNKQQESKDLQRKLTKLQDHNRLEYPPPVTLALAAVKEQLPQAQPQVLCDLVDIRDPQWQAAIEGYIGFNRFCIIVHPDYESRAIDLVRSLPRRGAQVIQGAKAQRDAGRLSLPADSIVHELIVDHPVAKAYLTAAYGSVLKVKQLDQLRMTPRGVTQQGHGSAAYKMFICQLQDHELAFGDNAREKVKLHLIKKTGELEMELKQLSRYASDLKRINSLCRAVGSIQAESVAHQLHYLAGSIHELEQQLAQLDLSSIHELEDELKSLEQKRRQLNHDRDHKNNEAGRISQQRLQKERIVEELKDSLYNLTENVDIAKQDVEKLQRFDPDYDAGETFERLQQQAQSPALQSREQIEKLIQKAADRAHNVKRAFRRILMEQYNPQAKQNEQVGLRVDELDDYGHTGSDFYAVSDAYMQIKTQLTRQRDIGLAEVSERLGNAQQAVNNAFTANFCHLIYDAIIRGQDRLERLNQELRGQKFGDEHYHFGWDWVPEYKRYYDFFVHVMKLESLGEGQDLFDDANMMGQLAQVRDEITQLLLSDDLDYAQKRLQEIGDYRNYRRYEIYKDTGRGEPVALSEYGTGSGGQLETPAYVIRAAAVSAAFRLREGKQHLRMVLIDESFAKMDEQRAKAVLAYLNKTMNFQVIFIMPTKAAGAFQPLLTHKFVFVKIPSASAPGELGTITHVDQQTILKENTENLFEQHRHDVEQKTIARFQAEHGDPN